MPAPTPHEHPRPAAWAVQDVLAAAASWWWAPPDATVVTGDITIVGWPAWAPHGVTVVTTASDRPPATLWREARDTARGWGHEHLHWWVTADTRPDMAPLLRSRGAEPVETVDVLARRLDPDRDLDTFPPSPDVTTRRVSTLDDLRDADSVDTTVWGQAPMDDDRLAAALAELHAPGARPTALRVVADLAGRPVATGGATLADPPRPGLGRVTRLWGAGTVPTARGRGAYTAVLATRLRLAARAGASLALVKGRVATSAPILARAGFTRYASETLLRLPV